MTDVRIAGDAPGSTFDDRGAELLRRPDGSYVVHHWTRWAGEGDRWEAQGTRWAAACWAVQEGYVDEAKREFGEDLMRVALLSARFYGIDSQIPRQPWEQPEKEADWPQTRMRPRSKDQYWEHLRRARERILRHHTADDEGGDSYP